MSLYVYENYFIGEYKTLQLPNAEPFMEIADAHTAERNL